MTYYNKRFLFFAVIFIAISKPVYGVNDNGWYLSASANINLSTYIKSQNLSSQSELGLFIDADYLEDYGLSAGFIRQDQGVKKFENISNSMLYLAARYYIYPESLPGKLALSLEAYDESQSLTVKTTRGLSPTFSTELINDSLKIVNPIISYLNYKKTFYLDLGYANSKYGSTDPLIGELEVEQWVPTVGFSFNNQYDWLQLRHYNINLSNDIRSPGITRTSANEFKLTHWLTKKKGSDLDNIQFIVLTGERLFAVDHDARKIYNLSDMQTATYSMGGNWKYLDKSEAYLYAGIERYKDSSLNEKYNNLFMYAGYKIHW